uniref:Uncharacterized protein n=1 Tax=Anguilla anguilla TaxID=7936 RepID=A0A0E9WLG0_ANGAN
MEIIFKKTVFLMFECRICKTDSFYFQLELAKSHQFFCELRAPVSYQQPVSAKDTKAQCHFVFFIQAQENIRYARSISVSLTTVLLQEFIYFEIFFMKGNVSYIDRGGNPTKSIMRLPVRCYDPKSKNVIGDKTFVWRKM